MMSGLILVTGGTGFLGREVVRQCLAAGHRVRVLARRPERGLDLARLEGCEVVGGDILAPNTLEPAFENVRAVIHCVGILSESASVSFEDIHIRGTKNVIDASQEACVRRFIHISAQGTRLVSRSRYHSTKIEGEKLLGGRPFDWTIIRPSLIYGRGDRSLSMLAACMRRRNNPAGLLALPLPGHGDRWIQPVPVEEVAISCVKALSNRETVKKTLVVAGAEALRWRDLVVAVGEASGRPVIFERYPWRAALRFLAWVLMLSLPLAFLLILMLGYAHLPLFLAMGAVWLVAVDFSLFWKTVLAFSLPAPVLWLGVHALDQLPRRWRIAEKVKLIEEDNQGPPGGVAALLRYQPVSLAEGLRRALGPQ